MESARASITSTAILIARRLLSAASLLAVAPLLFAQSGFIKSGAQAIPGATVTVSQGTQSFSTTTDVDGYYGFVLLAPGPWHLKVEMFGFDGLDKDVDFAAVKGPVNLDLHLTEPAYLQRMQTQAGGNNRGGSQAAALDPELQSALNSTSAPSASPAAGVGSGANETFLVSGSISPGAAEGAQPDFNGEPRFGGPGGFGNENGNGNPPGFGGNQGGGSPGGGGFGGGPAGGFAGAVAEEEVVAVAAVPVAEHVPDKIDEPVAPELSSATPAAARKPSTGRLPTHSRTLRRTPSPSPSTASTCRRPLTRKAASA